MDKPTRSARLPDLSERPFHLTLDRSFPLGPDILYRAWTQGLESWFAAPGSACVRAEVDAPFYFETEYRPKSHAGVRRHPHYGRFLQLVPDRLVQMTWVTGSGGTDGAETVLTVEFVPHGDTTGIRLTHAGFASEAARDAHEHAWPTVLEHLEQQLVPAQGA